MPAAQLLVTSLRQELHDLSNLTQGREEGELALMIHNNASDGMSQLQRAMGEAKVSSPHVSASWRRLLAHVADSNHDGRGAVRVERVQQAPESTKLVHGVGSGRWYCRGLTCWQFQAELIQGRPRLCEDANARVGRRVTPLLVLWCLHCGVYIVFMMIGCAQP